MEIAIALIALVIGFAIGRASKHDRPLGDLRVDRSDPDSGPMLFLELNADIPAIMRQRYATFRVKVENYLPHK